MVNSKPVRVSKSKNRRDAAKVAALESLTELKRSHRQSNVPIRLKQALSLADNIPKLQNKVKVVAVANKRSSLIHKRVTRCVKKCAWKYAAANVLPPEVKVKGKEEVPVNIKVEVKEELVTPPASPEKPLQYRKKSKKKVIEVSGHNEIFWQLFAGLNYPGVEKEAKDDWAEYIAMINTLVTDLEDVQILPQYWVPLSLFASIKCRNLLHFTINSDIPYNSWVSFLENNKEMTHMQLFNCWTHMYGFIAKLIARSLPNLVDLTLHMLIGHFMGRDFVEYLCRHLKNLRRLTIYFAAHDNYTLKACGDYRRVEVDIRWWPKNAQTPSLCEPLPMGVQCRVGQIFQAKKE